MRQTFIKFLYLLTALGISFPSVTSCAADLLLATNDTEGHVSPCQTCPTHVGLGGMARRATLLKSIRAKDTVLLLDAGNCFFGPQSVADQGKIIADAYSILNYDAINISWRDFRYGKENTLRLIKESKLSVVSANIIDSASHQLMFPPYLVKTISGKKVAIIGLTESPAGLDYLPHLKTQLQGMEIQSPLKALEAVLPTVRTESDVIVVLFYGSAKSLKALCDATTGVAVVFSGGSNEIPVDVKTAITTAEVHGKTIASFELATGKTGGINIDSSVLPDAAMAALIQAHEPVAAAIPPPVSKPTMEPPVNQIPEINSTASTPKLEMPAIAALPPNEALPPGTNTPIVPKLPDKPETQDTKPPVKNIEKALPRVAASQPTKPGGLEGVGLTGDQVNHAIDKGRDYLWGHLQALQSKYKLESAITDGPALLAALALVHADAHKKYPEFDAQVRKYLVKSNPRRNQMATYEAGLYCMLIDAYGDPMFLPKLRDTARYLMEIQGKGGTWGYGISVQDEVFGSNESMGAMNVFGGRPLEGENPGVEILKRITPYSDKVDGDNSVSQFALLGMLAASRWHITAEPELWKRNLAAYRERQCDDGGWQYNGKNQAGYGSMSCAGICGIAVNRYQLGQRIPAADRQIEEGLAWLENKFSVTENPGYGTTHHYYYLYSLERVGRILNTEFIGKHEWYPQGAKYLLTQQKPVGRWIESNESEDPRLPCSFALLFLTRATPTLVPEVLRGGDGEIRSGLASSPPAYLYVILDASGSMLDEMDGKLKFDFARDAVASMFEMLPPKSHAGLRVYGHRKRALDDGADEDTELLIPMGDYNRDEFIRKLSALRSRGKTPLALSLTEAMRDLGTPTERTTVVLLTDGGEDTIPRRDPVKTAEEFGKIKNIDFHIIGFDVADREDWNAQLIAMSEAAHAHYWPAPKAADLRRTMRVALLGDPEYFRIENAQGQEVFRGKFGDGKTLPEGKYEMITPFLGKEFKQPFWINTKTITAVTFDATKAFKDTSGKTLAKKLIPEKTDTSKNPEVPEVSKPAPPVSPLAKRFCTNCGKPLTVNAKFCTNCGARVAE